MTIYYNLLLMKTVFLLALSVAAISCWKNAHRHHKKTRQFTNPYTDYTPLSTNDQVDLMVLDGSGKMRRESVPKKDLLKPYKLCLPDSPDYKLCYEVKDCATCARLPMCGWCDSTHKCVGGNNQGQVCGDDCLHGWIFQDQRCSWSEPNGPQIKAGMMTNVAMDSKEIITPEQVDNSNLIRVNDIEHEYHSHVHTQQVGTVTQQSHLTAQNMVDGQLYHAVSQ